MQMYPRLFPQHRLNDPFRQAERRIFQALEACGAPGFACYEWQRNKQSLQLDFALWVPGVGRFGLQVKGGYYSFAEGEWYRRRGRKGPHVMVNACPLAVTSDATMSLLNEVSETLAKPNYFVPVLLFPDMDPNAAISARAQRSNVHLVWRTGPAAAPTHRDRRGGQRAPPTGRGGHPEGGGGHHRRPGPVFGVPRHRQPLGLRSWTGGFALRSRGAHQQRRKSAGSRRTAPESEHTTEGG